MAQRLPPLLFVVVSVLLLLACESADSPTAGLAAEAQRPSEPAEESGSRQESVAETEVPAPPETATPRPEPAVQRLLDAAEQAMLVNHLTTPEYDNAYDRYRAVLLLSPDHPQALEGLKQIQLRYVEMSRDALNRGQFSQARELLQRAAVVSGGEELIAEVRNDIEDARQAYLRRRQQQPPAVTPAFDGEEMTFNAVALSRKETSVVNRLQELAVKVRSSGETLLIVARNDAEGRWIYKTMNDAVPGYRLRGDIKLGRTPKVRLLPPIE